MLRPRSRCPVKFFLGVLCLAGVGVLCVEPGLCQRILSIQGQVLAEGNQIIRSKVSVVLEAFDGKPVAELTADSQGQFEINNLYKQIYYLTASADGFYPLQQTVEMRSAAGQTFQLRLVLTPRRSANPPTASPPPSLTDMNAPRKARKYYEKGLRALRVKELTDAQGFFEKAVAEYPCYAGAQTRLGVIFSDERDYPRAEASLRKAIQCDAGMPEAFIALGEILSAEKNFVESASTLQEGLRRFPGAWQFYDQLATAHYNLGQYAKAVEEWRRAASLDSAPLPDLHAKLAGAYLRQGANEQARIEMGEYLRTEPKGRFATTFKTILQRLETAGNGSSSSSEAGPPPASKP